ncbi:hypothetical protein [Spiroplasma endosymbiont of Seladonia tumulorum]|uniref:hypothetical protein n=1 Tax=Spiroplasma endosymbiont of Seladonia tumulorum TaxID=3066321 RepID=UPI0030CA7ACF
MLNFYRGCIFIWQKKDKNITNIHQNLEQKSLRKLNNPKGPKISFAKRNLKYYKTRYELLKKLHDFYN